MTIQRVLHTARTIAIVGLSNNELRASYFVGYYLKRHGYRVIPVNPREQPLRCGPRTRVYERNEPSLCQALGWAGGLLRRCECGPVLAGVKVGPARARGACPGGAAPGLRLCSGWFGAEPEQAEV